MDGGTPPGAALQRLSTAGAPLAVCRAIVSRHQTRCVAGTLLHSPRRPARLLNEADVRLLSCIVRGCSALSSIHERLLDQRIEDEVQKRIAVVRTSVTAGDLSGAVDAVSDSVGLYSARLEQVGKAQVEDTFDRRARYADQLGSTIRIVGASIFKSFLTHRDDQLLGPFRKLSANETRLRRHPFVTSNGRRVSFLPFGSEAMQALQSDLEATWTAPQISRGLPHRFGAHALAFARLRQLAASATPDAFASQVGAAMQSALLDGLDGYDMVSWCVQYCWAACSTHINSPAGAALARLVRVHSAIEAVGESIALVFEGSRPWASRLAWALRLARGVATDIVQELFERQCLMMWKALLTKKVVRKRMPVMQSAIDAVLEPMIALCHGCCPTTTETMVDSVVFPMVHEMLCRLAEVGKRITPGWLNDETKVLVAWIERHRVADAAHLPSFEALGRLEAVADLLANKNAITPLLRVRVPDYATWTRL
ncbi:Uncharacterized protein PBTT_01736 [Plasmodiophora brassicae]